MQATVNLTASSTCVFTAIGGRQSASTRHTTAITKKKAPHLASPKLPIKKAAKEAALSGNEQSSFQKLLSAKCLSNRTNRTKHCINHPADSVLWMTE